MAKREVVVWGESLGESERAAELRRFVGEARSRGYRCRLCLTAAAGTTAGVPVPITDGVGERRLFTRVAVPELERLIEAARVDVAGTAPVAAFGGHDAVRVAGLEFPDASAIVAASGLQLAELCATLEEHWRTAPLAEPRGLDAAVLEPFLALDPVSGAERTLLHFAGTGDDPGTDAFVAACAAAGWTGRVRIHGPDPIRGRFAGVDHANGPVQPALFDDVLAVVQPMRTFADWPAWTVAMAAGRALIASRFGDSADLVGDPGVVLPIGGRRVGGGRGELVPDPRCLEDHLRQLVREPASARAIAIRGRAHVVARHRSPALARRPRAARPQRPSIVLEAPLFELSSSSVLTVETARALVARGDVDVALVPRRPFRGTLDEFRGRAPDLVDHLVANPARADLWITSGWPPRFARPDARCFAARIDWEYGALPTELSPAVTQEADRVIVHSGAVARAVASAGRPPSEIELIPHGVNAAVFHEGAPPLAEVVQFKRDRRAVLFVGELIWRKGFDVVLKLMLEQRSAEPLCLVVKQFGSASSYQGYHLGELLDRFRAVPGGVETMVIDDTLDDRCMAGLYTACDLLLHPYRGEGFGLPVLEARACGLPVIATAGGSTDDFVGASGGVRVPAERRAVDLGSAHDGQPWVLEPDPAAAAELLSQALNGIGRFRAQARAAASEVRRRFAWSRAAERLAELAFEARGVVAEPPLSRSL